MSVCWPQRELQIGGKKKKKNSSLLALRHGNSSHETIWTHNSKLSQYLENIQNTLIPWHSQLEPLIYRYPDCKEDEGGLH